MYLDHDHVLISALVAVTMAVLSAILIFVTVVTFVIGESASFYAFVGAAVTSPALFYVAHEL